MKKDVGPKIKDFKAALADGGDQYPELVALKKDVTAFANKFATVGY